MENQDEMDYSEDNTQEMGENARENGQNDSDNSSRNRRRNKQYPGLDYPLYADIIKMTELKPEEESDSEEDEKEQPVRRASRREAARGSRSAGLSPEEEAERFRMITELQRWKTSLHVFRGLDRFEPRIEAALKKSNGTRADLKALRTLLDDLDRNVTVTEDPAAQADTILAKLPFIEGVAQALGYPIPGFSIAAKYMCKVPLVHSLIKHQLAVPAFPPVVTLIGGLGLAAFTCYAPGTHSVHPGQAEGLSSFVPDVGQPTQPPVYGPANAGQPTQPPVYGPANAGQPTQPPVYGPANAGQPTQPPAATGSGTPIGSATAALAEEMPPTLPDLPTGFA